MLPILFKYMKIVLCMTTIVHADYWKFTLNRTKCVEPREWDIDHVYFRINMVTRGQDGKLKQNQTTDRGGSTDFPRGSTSLNNYMWKDITLDQGDMDLLVTFTGWNKGDEDPQKVGLEIAQLVLKVLRGNLAVSVTASAISFVIGQFKDAYDCHGPVILDVLHYSRGDLRNMPYGQSRCTTDEYSYQTQRGCIDSQPLVLTAKVSRYTSEHCIQRFQGSSTNSGQTGIHKVGSGERGIEPFSRWLGFETLAIMVLGWLNAM